MINVNNYNLKLKKLTIAQIVLFSILWITSS